MLFVVRVRPDLPLAKKISLDPRLQITQVCAGWRQIAFAIPKLWKIRLSRIPDRSSTSKLINAWWSQCSGSLLVLTMNKRVYVQKSDGISFDHFLFEYIIAPYCARLVQLDIIMQAETARMMLALPAGSFKALKILDLTVERVDDSNPLLPSDNLHTAFSSSPHLSTVAFRAIPLTDPLLLHLPWQQLTRFALVLQVIPADNLLLLLSYCQLLSSCVIGGLAIDADVVIRISSMPRLHLPKLKRLCLTFVSMHNHHHFLRALSLPNIRDLDFLNTPSCDWAPPHYATFFQSIRSTLTIFRVKEHPDFGLGFGRGGTTERHFDDLLISCMPQVETFELSNRFTVSASTLEKIAHGELLPSVTNIKFSVNNVRSLLEMLEARLSRSRKRDADGQIAISAIKNVVVSCVHTPGMDDMIHGLKDQGINVQFQVLP